MSRPLLIIPIVHAKADLGSLGEQITARRQAASEALISDFWDQVRTHVLTLDVDFTALHLYQDGLPVCGMEVAIVNDIAKQGSPNFQLLLDLMQRGATLHGTESPSLLRQEYEWIRQPHLATPEAAAALLIERDRFIAAEIDRTLPSGATGLIFLGMLHRIEDHLPPTISFRHPLKITA